MRYRWFWEDGTVTDWTELDDDLLSIKLYTDYRRPTKALEIEWSERDKQDSDVRLYLPGSAGCHCQ